MLRGARLLGFVVLSLARERGEEERHGKGRRARYRKEFLDKSAFHFSLSLS
jgi:hypothetical protein